MIPGLRPLWRIAPLVILAVVAGCATVPTARVLSPEQQALAERQQTAREAELRRQVDWSLAGLLSWVGLGDWAQSVGGLFTLSLSSISGSIPFLLMLIVLLVRPAGLMGERN